MLNETTINVMNALKLHGMAKGFELRLGDSKQAGLSHAEFTGMLVEDEKIYVAAAVGTGQTAPAGGDGGYRLSSCPRY